MSAFVLKIIACISMILDHTSIVLFNGNNWVDYIGRFAFPIFAYLIGEGYIHTKNVKKYLIRLFITALLAEIPFMIIVNTDYIPVNTIFTLIFGLLSIIIYDKVNKYLGFIIALVLGVLANIFHFDHGMYGVIIIFLFYVLRNKKVFKFIVYELVTIIWYAYRIFKYNDYGNTYLINLFKYYFPYLIFHVLAVIPIVFYNGKEGYKSKYLFYIVYVVHLIILCLIKYIFL